MILVSNFQLNLFSNWDLIVPINSMGHNLITLLSFLLPNAISGIELPILQAFTADDYKNYFTSEHKQLKLFEA